MQKRTRGVLYNFGIYEAGEYTATESGKATRLYDLWSKMIQRCYSEKSLVVNKSYVGCSVDARFKEFQDFCTWAVAQRGFAEGYCLDKDLLSFGNKVYSPDTCVFVPTVINTLTVNCKHNRGAYPVGVSYHTRNKTFTAKVSIGMTKTARGGFSDPHSAFLFYKAEKEKGIKMLAERYKDSIDVRVYKKLQDWEVKIDD